MVSLLALIPPGFACGAWVAPVAAAWAAMNPRSRQLRFAGPVLPYRGTAVSAAGSQFREFPPHAVPGGPYGRLDPRAHSHRYTDSYPHRTPYGVVKPQVIGPSGSPMPPRPQQDSNLRSRLRRR